jgi:hypothetical protein
MTPVFLAPEGVDITHQVHTIDLQEYPELSGKFPLTNMAMTDNGYIVTFLVDAIIHDSYGGKDGTVILAAQVVVAGMNTMIDTSKGSTVIDCPFYNSDSPDFTLPFTGNSDTSNGAITLLIQCCTESELFGLGDDRAHGEIMLLDATGGTRVLFDWR